MYESSIVGASWNGDSFKMRTFHTPELYIDQVASCFVHHQTTHMKNHSRIPPIGSNSETEASGA